MIYLWLGAEIILMTISALLWLKGDIAPAIMASVAVLYCQNCRLEESRKTRERMSHYGIRMNP